MVILTFSDVIVTGVFSGAIVIVVFSGVLQPAIVPVIKTKVITAIIFFILYITLEIPVLLAPVYFLNPLVFKKASISSRCWLR